MHINRFKSLIFTFCLGVSTSLLGQGSSGQNFIRSPYTNYGLGEWMHTNLAQAGTAQHTYGGFFSHSLSNPATLGNTRYTVFDFGGNYRNGNTTQGDQVNYFQGGSIDYLSLAMPIWKYVDQKLLRYDTAKDQKYWKYTPYGATTAVALRPLSSMGYTYYIDNNVGLPTRTAYLGSGGVNMLQWNTGVRLGNSVNLGYGMGYVFGTTRDNAVFTVIDSFGLGAVEDAQSMVLRGMQQQVGVLFEHKIDSTYHRLGFSYEWYSGVEANTNRLAQSMEIIGGATRVLDTIINEQGVTKSISMPASFGVGYSFRYRRSFMLALDWRTQLWSQYKGMNNTDVFRDRNDYSVTLFINPMDLKAPNEKKMKVPVRLSYGLSESQIMVQQGADLYGLQEQRYGLGFGIPIIRRYFDNSVLTNVIQINVQYMTRATKGGNFPREQFITVGVGVQFGDIWFAKRKYD